MESMKLQTVCVCFTKTCFQQMSFNELKDIICNVESFIQKHGIDKPFCKINPLSNGTFEIEFFGYRKETEEECIHRMHETIKKAEVFIENYKKDALLLDMHQKNINICEKELEKSSIRCKVCGKPAYKIHRLKDTYKDIYLCKCCLQEINT